MPAPNVASATARAAKKTGATIKPTPQRQAAKRSAATIFTVSQLLERYRDPRAILLEIAGMDTAKLAEQTGCSLIEALQERRLCAMAVLPYVVQKLPTQVDMRHTRAITVNLLDKDEYERVEALTIEEGETDTIEGQLVTTPTRLQ
jgi:hypothetical protein